MTNETLERQIIQLIATDRIDIPISSMSGKLKRRKPKLAEAVSIPKGTRFNGERVYARVEVEDRMKARTMSDAVAKYCEEHPAEGKVLTQYIEDERAVKEIYLHFGVQEGKRLTAEDYLGVMENLGFSPATARSLYPELMDISRKIQTKREYAERSILIG
jgi:hypothetical protein